MDVRSKRVTICLRFNQFSEHEAEDPVENHLR